MQHQSIPAVHVTLLVACLPQNFGIHGLGTMMIGRLCMAILHPPHHPLDINYFQTVGWFMAVHSEHRQPLKMVVAFPVACSYRDGFAWLLDES